MRDDYLRRDLTFRSLFSSQKSKLATAEELLDAMDKAQVDIAVVMGYGWTDPDVAREANDYLLESAARYPRLVPFCSVNPAWGQAAIDEVERCAGAGAKGIGELHPDTQGYDITEFDTISGVMRAAEQLGLVVLTHSSEPVGHDYPGKGQTTPDRLLAFCCNFPRNTVVCAHWGGGLPFYSLMPEVRESLSNVYFDTAATPFLYRAEVYSTVARSAGRERVLFGSDYPLMAYSRSLGQVREAELSPEDLEHVLWRNAANLLDL